MNLLDQFRARWFDFIHNVDTHSEVRLTNLEVVGDNKPHGVMYSPTLPRSMRRLFNALQKTGPETTFIDIGCGKGLTLLVARSFRFKKVVGVEFSPKLHSIAEQNMKRYRGLKRCEKIEILCQDAVDFQFPSGPLLVYFFNPFSNHVLVKVLERIAAALRQEERDIVVICDKLHDRDLMIQYLAPRKVETVLGFSVYSQLRPPPHGAPPT